MNKNKPFNLIYEAEWNDIPCVDYPLTPEKWASESIRPLVGTQVDALFYNLCSSDGYCCGLENGQILMDNFEKVGNAWVWRYRENTKKLIEADANPPKLAVEYCRKLGIKCVPVVRMNDAHDMYFRYEVTAYKKANPHLLIGYEKGYVDWEKGVLSYPETGTIDSHTWGMFDYAHEEVREHRFRIVEEFITRWDNDGVSLDFDRDPWYFKTEGCEENCRLMTELIRRIRGVLDEQAKKRGKPQYLHVRLIPEIDVCWNRGLDIRTWVEEGLVDAISPGCGYMTLTLDLAPWLELVEGKDCWIYPSNNHWKTPEQTRSWAKLMYQRGAHGLYLFNWGHLLYGFDKDTKPTSERFGTVWFDELNPRYYEVLKQIGCAETLAYENATYALESIPRDVPDRGEAGAGHRQFRAVDAIELPVEMTVGNHSTKLPFAEDIEGARARGFSPELTLRLKLVNYTTPDKFDVTINGTLLNAATRRERAVFIMNDDTWIEYPIDQDLLDRGNNEVKVTVHSLNPQMSVTPVLQNVELVVRYAGR